MIRVEIHSCVGQLDVVLRVLTFLDNVALVDRGFDEINQFLSTATQITKEELGLA